MELNDLRRHWQQPEPVAPPALTGREVDKLAKGRAADPIEKMRRNARLEAGLTAAITVGVAVALFLVHDTLAVLYAGFAFVTLGILLGFYYRMLGVLQRMLAPTGSVRGHLTTLAKGLRQLLRFYYRLSLAVVPTMAVLIASYVLWRVATGDKVKHWQPILAAGGLFLVVGMAGQVLVVYGTRWWLQRLYGCHLDHLEGQLRELEESPPADADAWPVAQP